MIGKHRDRWWLALVILLAAFLRLFRLGYPSLWVDECMFLRYWVEFSRLPTVEQLLWGVRGWSLHNLLMGGLWIRLGTSEFWLRLPSAVCGVATVYVAYRLALRWLGRRGSLVAATLLALSPFHVWYSQEARPYAMLMLLATLSMLAFVRWLDSNADRDAVAWLASTALAISTFRPALYLLIVQGLFLVVHRRRYGMRLWCRLKRPVGLVVTALVLLAASPWALTSAKYLTRAILEPTSVFVNLQPVTPIALPYTFFAFTAGFSAGPSVAELHLPGQLEAVRTYGVQILAYALVFGGLFLWGLWRLRRRGELMLLLVLWVLLPPVVMYVLALLTGHAYNVRYASPAVIGYFTVLAAALTSAAPGAASPAARVLVQRVAFVLCLALLSASLAGHYFNPKYGKVDSRSVARTIEAGQREGDVILISSYWAFEALGCYYDAGLPMVRLDRRLPESELASQLEPVLDRGGGLWLVSGQPWPRGQRGIYPRALSRLTVADSWEFTGVDLYRLEP